ncbi:MAG: hypothetical protein M1823_001370 [Watsoniomyces obsoletus]|nr:MAG: hypothetical protein M1823_001370 [Watsoniomyces obsoletus]
MSLHANGTQLIYNSTSHNLTWIQHLIQRTLDEKGYQMRMFCTYPVSGQYGPLPRALYYILLLAGVLWRGHPWIAVAYLGVAMTYSASAAVHAFALIARYRFGRYPNWVPTPGIRPSDLMDADWMPIGTILRSAGIMLTPLLNWSSALHHSRRKTVLVAWGALIWVAIVAQMLAVRRGSSLYLGETTTTCFTGGAEYCAASDTWRSKPAYLTALKPYWVNCRCRDTCSQMSHTHAPYREGTNLVPYHVNTSARMVIGSEFLRVAYFSFLLGIFVIIQGFLALIQARWTQGTVRSLIFRRLYGRHSSSAPDSRRQRVRFQVAKSTAWLLYLFAVVMSVFCPPLFVCNLVLNEIRLAHLPRGEPFGAVGQWAPCVSAVFVLFAALIQRYEELAIKWIRRGGRHFYMRLSRSPARREAAPPLPGVGEVVKFAGSQLLLPFRGIYLQLVDGRKRLMQERRQSSDWYEDPVGQSMR